MATQENMMLSYPYDAKKAVFPGFLSRKYDGVPGGYTNQCLLSRQAKRMPGVQWIHDIIHEHIPVGIQLWGEHYQYGKDFKYINGKTKAHTPWYEAEVKFFNLFDMFNPSRTFEDRHSQLCAIVENIKEKVQLTTLANNLEVVQQVYVADEDELHRVHEAFRINAMTYSDDNFEGCMYHPADGLYVLTRSWDSMKLVEVQTHDLVFVRCDEAVSKTGNPLGRAGKLYFKDATGEEFGCGPGKLKHPEAKDIFMNPSKYVGKMGVIRSKPGGGYEKLREPTFQHWRDDKTEPDTVNGGK